MSSRRLPATRVLATRHRRQEDHRRARAYLGVESFARSNILAFDVDVDEPRDITVFDDLFAQRRESRHQVVEQVAHRRAFGFDLSRAADFRTQRRWDANDAQAGSLVPAQNST